MVQVFVWSRRKDSINSQALSLYLPKVLYFSYIVSLGQPPQDGKKNEKDKQIQVEWAKETKMYFLVNTNGSSTKNGIWLQRKEEKLMSVSGCCVYSQGLCMCGFAEKKERKC